MRGYVEQMERLAFNMPEGRNPTDAEVCAAMADRQAYRADALRDDDEAIPGRDDLARCAELAALDDVVSANIRQMAGPNPINQRDEE